MPAARSSGVATAGTSLGLKLRMIIGERHASASRSRSRRHVTFVSPDTESVDIAVTGPQTADVVVNVSPGAPGCTASIPRTCAITVLSGIPVGTYGITVTSYDAPPVNGKIPSSAHELATGSVSGIAVTVGTYTTASIFIGGLVATYGNSSAFISEPANGTPQMVGFALNPMDFDNEPIVTNANSTTVPYSNPITVTLTESGGAGHESLYVAGASAGLTTTLGTAAQAAGLTVHYDGLGSAGYSGLVTLSAAGAPTQSVNVTPMYVVPTAYGASSSGSSSVTFTAAGQTSALAISEAAGSATYSASTSGCAGIATIGTPTGSGSTGSALLGSGANVGTGCSVWITDSVLSTTKVAIAVSSSTTTGGLTVPGPFAEYTSGLTPASQPLYFALGADGRVWFTEIASSKIGAISTSGSITEYSTPTASSSPYGIAAGPDGRLWFCEWSAGANKIGAVTTSGTFQEYPIPTGAAQPTGITAGSDGRLWFAESALSRIAAVTTGGTFTEYSSTTTGAPFRLTSGPDGRLWFTELSGSAPKIGAMTTTGTLSEYSIGSAGYGIVSLGSNLWLVESGSSKIGVITTAGTLLHEYATPTSVAAPTDIAVGADGNVWYTESNANNIGVVRVSTGAGAEYAVPSASAQPLGIITGPDGRMWFSEHAAAASKIGAFTP